MMKTTDDSTLGAGGRYRRVFVRIWADSERLTDSERLLLFYVQTGPQTNRCGIFTFSLGRAAEDLNADISELRTRLQTLIDRFGLRYDERARVLFDPTWLERNYPDNPNILTGWLKDVEELPETSLRTDFDAVVETLRETFTHGREERSQKRSSKRSGEPAPQQGVGVGIDSGRRSRSRNPLPPAETLARFERFWSAYPKKRSRDRALAAWTKRSPDDALTDLILSAIDRQKRSPDWLKDDGQFIPHPATWLNDARWSDEPAIAITPSSPAFLDRDDVRRMSRDRHAAMVGPRPIIR